MKKNLEYLTQHHPKATECVFLVLLDQGEADPGILSLHDSYTAESVKFKFGSPEHLMRFATELVEIAEDWRAAVNGK